MTGKRAGTTPWQGVLDRWKTGKGNKPWGRLSDSARKRYFKIFPGLEKRYLEWLKKDDK